MNRNIQNSENWGWNLKTNVGEDSASITPTLLYKVADNISLNTDITIDSNMGLKFTTGLSYQVSDSSNGGVFLATTLKDGSHDDWLALQQTMVIFRLAY